MENQEINDVIQNGILKASQIAAIEASQFIGSGKKNDADGAAVKGMRDVLSQIDFCAEVVIGEGEMDEAPMLYIGERLGSKSGKPNFDIAVDPLEGTNLCANNMPNAITTIAIGAAGTLLKAPDIYMQKIAAAEVSDPSVLDINLSIGENIKRVAQYKNRKITDMSIILLDRPRHKAIVDEARALGVRVSYLSDGDIYGVLATHQIFGDVDIYVGSGGAPEGVLAAVAIKALGGTMQGKLIFEDNYQRKRSSSLCAFNIDSVFSVNDMVQSRAIFAATGVTKGFLKPAQITKFGFSTHSIVLDTMSGIKFIESYHKLGGSSAGF